MSTRALVLLLVASVWACAQASVPAAPASPPSLPDLSAPSRFRPTIIGLDASPRSIKVGETSLVTARVRGFRSGSPTWTAALDPSSSANGTLSETCGAGDVRVSFTANYKGNAMVEVHASDSFGVPAVTQSVAITVEP